MNPSGTPASADRAADISGKAGAPAGGPAQDLARAIGLWGGVAIIVGTVIGSGIFRTPASIARVLQDPPLILGLWAGFGLVSLCGALTLAELATLLPKTGGTYVYLRAAYGDAAAFVFGWLYLLAATPAGIGSLATFFGELVVRLLHGPEAKVPAGFVPTVGTAAIALLCASNIVGVRFGSAVQMLLTVIKVSALVALIVLAFAFGDGDVARLGARSDAAGSRGGLQGLARAAGSVIFAYNGWVYIGLVAGEVTHPERRMKRIIIAALLTIIGLYLGANLAYFYMVPVQEMAGEKVVAMRLMTHVLGPWGGVAIGLCIAASVFGSLNGVLLTKTRVPYALARDGLTFSVLGRCHPRLATPYVSILVQGAVAVVLVLWLKEFDSISSYFVVVEWFALIFAIASVFVLRRRMPDAPRPYRTPGYPWVPLLFILGTVLGLSGAIWGRARDGDWAPVIGLGIALAGFPVYWIWRRATVSRCNGPRTRLF